VSQRIADRFNALIAESATTDELAKKDLHHRDPCVTDFDTDATI
jgi:hypothetical protein